MQSRGYVRVAALVVTVLCAGVVGHAYATAPASVATAADDSIDGSLENGTRVVPPRDNVTVVATDSNTWLGLESDGPRANAELVAFAPDGSTLYYDDTHTRYWDVDPVANTSRTVEYLYADHLNASECGGEQACTRNGIERVNLTTGETSTVFARITPGKHATRWHDADRLDESRYVVGDIDDDRVFVVNTSTGIVEWAWSAQTAFDVTTTGGPYPEDWTHLNDVEVTEEGRIVASLRNHDRVVFLDRETGLVEGRTLGSGDHDVLYEQHNPDVVESEDGPPSVLVADSENNRVVEYRAGSADGETNWTRTWVWYDEQLQWPRDADRLPNGHTLVTDSNGDRVVEVDESGDVVWSVPVAFPYEAERLGTGDESAGGPTAATIDATNRTGAVETASAGDETDGNATGSSPGGFAGLTGPEANAVSYVLPRWMGLPGLAAVVLGGLVLAGWVSLELYWTPYTVAVQSPIGLRREDQ